MKVIVSDWDNTWTDIETGIEPYREGYIASLATAVRMKRDEVQKFVDHLETSIVIQPDGHNWELNGFPVAPAVADPFMRLRRAATLLLKALGKNRASEQDQILEPLYRENYPKVELVFHDGADETFREILLTFPDTFYVVSNSDPRPVQKQVSTLIGKTGLPAPSGNWLEEHVIGGAKKYLVTADPKGVLPMRTVLPGFPIPVFPRRGHYYNAFQKIANQHGSDVRELKFLGDLYKLDLLSPDLLGAGVGLLTNYFTPLYEIAYLRTRPNGRILTDIRQASAFFREN